MQDHGILEEWAILPSWKWEWIRGEGCISLKDGENLGVWKWSRGRGCEPEWKGHAQFSRELVALE